MQYLIATACIVVIADRLVAWYWQYRGHRLIQKFEHFGEPPPRHTFGDKVFGHIFAWSIWALFFGAIVVLGKLFPGVIR